MKWPGSKIGPSLPQYSKTLKKFIRLFKRVIRSKHYLYVTNYSEISDNSSQLPVDLKIFTVYNLGIDIDNDFHCHYFLFLSDKDSHLERE